MATIISIGSNVNAEAKHKKGWRLTTKKDVTLTAKESKKYVKASKIKFTYDTQKNTFELTSFKKNKYAPVSKKTFAKNYTCEVLAIDGKKYSDFSISECLDTNNKCDLGSKTAEKILSKIGKHKVKLKVHFMGNKGWGKYGRTFYWSGIMNVKESCMKDSLSNKYNKKDLGIVVCHTYKMSKDCEKEDSQFCFAVKHLVTNVNAKLDLTVKYTFDKDHISSKDLQEFAKNHNMSIDELMSRIESVGSTATFTKSFDVKPFDATKAQFKPYYLDIENYPQFNAYYENKKTHSLYELWKLFKPEVTYKVTSKSTGKVLFNKTTTNIYSNVF